MKRKLENVLTLVIAALLLFPLLASCSSSGSAEAIPWNEYDELIERIKAELDPAEKEAFLHIAEDMLMETECIVPIYNLTDSQLIKSTLTGVYSTGYGAKYFSSVQNGERTEARLIFCEAPNSLDPAFAENTTALTLVANLFSGLYTYDASGNVVPDLAQSCTVSDDGLVYTFTLKTRLSWSNTASAHLGASDFIYAWRRVADDETKSPYAHLTDIIAEDEDGKLMLTADETDTVLTVTLKSPCDYFLELCAFSAFYPVHESSVEYAKGYKDLYGNIIDPEAWTKTEKFPVNGAFYVYSFTDKSIYSLAANTRSTSVIPTMKSIFVMIKTNVAEAYAAYTTGEGDYLGSIPNTSGIDTSSPEYSSYGIDGVYLLCHNFNSKLYRGMSAENAALLRRAISLYIDRGAIVANVTGGGETVATSIVPMSISDGSGGIYRKNTGAHRYPNMSELGYSSSSTEKNREEAREIIKALGLDTDGDGKIDSDKAITVKYLTVKEKENILIAQSIQQDLAELGITVKINAVSESIFDTEQQFYTYDMVSVVRCAYYDDATSLLENYITGAKNNFAHLGSVAIEEDKNAY